MRVKLIRTYINDGSYKKIHFNKGDEGNIVGYSGGESRTFAVVQFGNELKSVLLENLEVI